MFLRIDEKLLVSGQIRTDDLPSAAAQGVTMIVNNRPDGEQPGQPEAAEIEAAAAAAGLGYRHIAIRGRISEDQIREMTEAMAATDGQVLAFCTSDTRSIWLWALARARAGDNPDEIVAKAQAGGYDLTLLRPYLG